MTEVHEVERALAAFQAARDIEVIENGRRVGSFSHLHYEVVHNGPRTLLHLWSQDRNLVRCILRLKEESAVRVVFETRQFGKKKPGKLEINCRRRVGSLYQPSREDFCAGLARLLAEQFPDERLEFLTTASDLEHSLSGCYSRGLIRRGRSAWAVMAASPGEDPNTCDEILTYGLIWLRQVHRQLAEWKLEGIRLILPEGTSQLTVHRMHALRNLARVELYEVHELGNRIRRVDPQDIGNLRTSLTPRRELEYTVAEAGEWVSRIRSIAPDAIGVGTPPGTRDVAFRFRGLEVARWHRGKIHFGLEGRRQELTPQCWSDLERLVRELDKYRHPFALDTVHPLYRAQPERWLESLVQGDPLRVHPRLDPTRVYSQVPAFAAGNRGVIDLLGVTVEGRLVIMELKANEDIHLLLQAVDYWQRVSWHQAMDNFHRFGYFNGVELQQKAPVVLLIAPSLRFHPTLDSLLPFLREDIEVMRVGLNENWRQGLQIVFRQ